MIREFDLTSLIEPISKLVQSANFDLDESVVKLLKEFYSKETNETARDILKIIIENQKLAREQRKPLCQDTGVAVFFLEIGQDIHFVNGDLETVINQAVSKGYKEGYLRKSIVTQPFSKRINTKDNTPAIINTKIVPGNKLKIEFAPKGGGAENMSRIAMLKPTEGKAGVINFVKETVSKAGGNPCPPIIVGVGIGGSFDYAALLAKKALFKPIDTVDDDEEIIALENQLLNEINQTNIGPQGLGGDTTALKVNVMTAPCHIASMPVAVNIQCHSHRHKSLII